MDFPALSREIGVAELVCCVANCADEATQREAARFLPAVSADGLQTRLAALARAIVAAGWQQVLLLSPETMLVEKLALAGFPGRLVVCVPREVDELASQRIRRNVPAGIDVGFIEEGAFPARFLPGRAAVLALGCGDGQRACLPASTVRMLEYYAGFSGQRALASLGCGLSGERPLGWVERTTTDLFNTLIDGEERP